MRLAAEVCEPRGGEEGGLRRGRFDPGGSPFDEARLFFPAPDQQVVLSPPRLLSVELAILFLFATSNAGCITTRRCGVPACEGIRAEVRSACPPADGGLKTSGGGPECFPPLLFARYTNTLLVVSVLGLHDFFLFLFFLRAGFRLGSVRPAVSRRSLI